MNLKTKTAIFAGLVGFALVAVAAFAPVAKVEAQTSAELNAQIQALLAQIAALQGQVGGSTSGHTFTMDLTVGSSGAEVTALQQWLVSKGFLTMPAGVSMGYFGEMTRAAVAAYQTSKGITPASGYFGPVTRASVNAMVVVTPTPGTNPGTNPTPGTNPGLEGGAGSVESYELISSLSNEEVGEDEEDSEVAGLEIEADDNSDLEITAVKLVFDEGTATSDFEDYAAEVSIWLDGEEFARVDGDDFNDNNNWTKTLSLDSGAIIRAGDTGELVVAVSGISNLDSGDTDDTWTVDFRQIRFEDADGAVITEDPTEDPRTFSFESFATAVDAELKVSSDDDSINDSHIIDIDDSDNTDEVSVLSFTLEAEGDSDLLIDEIPVNFDALTATGTTAKNVDALISTVYLFADGEEIGSENLGSAVGTDETVTFDDLDYTISAGDEIAFVVKADFNDTDAGTSATESAEGDTLSAQISATERAAIDVEDESGEDLVSGDRSGTAVGEAHAVYEDGIMVEFVSVTETKTFSADDAGEKDRVTFVFKYDITAFDGDFFLDKELVATATPNTITDGNAYATTSQSTTGTSTGASSVISSTETHSSDTTHAFFLEEDETRSFTLTVELEAQIDGTIQTYISGFNWGTAGSADSSADQMYTFNLDNNLSDAVTVNVI